MNSAISALPAGSVCGVGRRRLRYGKAAANTLQPALDRGANEPGRRLGHAEIRAAIAPISVRRVSTLKIG